MNDEHVVNDHAHVARGHIGMENHDVNTQAKEINAIIDMLMRSNINEDYWIQRALKEPLSNGAIIS